MEAKPPNQLAASPRFLLSGYLWRPTTDRCRHFRFGRLKDRETKLSTNTGAEELGLSLRGAGSDEAISGCGQRWLRSARHDTSTLCHRVGVLSHSPKHLQGIRSRAG